MIKLSHLDKIYWPEDRITKGELLQYYTAVAPFILPYLKNRPLVLHRFPNGIKEEGFYQKEIGKSPPKIVKTISVQHTEKKINYMVVQNIQSLLYAVNLGSIELHPFNSSIASLNKPDYAVLDLDPENVSFDAVVEVALVAHEILEKARIPHFCKTSGGRGLHIYIPLKAKYDYNLAKNLAHSLATLICEKIPKLTSLQRNPQKRQKRVYVDYLQNNKGQTLACAYSVRAKPHAPVSTPLLWKEVKYGLDPLQFTLKTLPKRLKQKGDLFKGVLKKGPTIKLISNYLN